MTDSTEVAPAWLTRPDDPNQLADGLWPDTADRDGAGDLRIGGVPSSTLAETFGTPLYVIDRDTAVSSARRIRDAFATAFEAVGSHVQPYYASKALMATEVVRWMLDEGYRIDVATGGELAFALAAGAQPSQLGLHGNNKSDEELRLATSIGVGTIVIDSLEEVGRVARFARAAGRVQRVQLRVNSGVHAHTHEFLATAREDQKFGIALDDVPEAARLVRSYPDALDLVGLHSHIGSQIFDAAAFDEAIRRLLAVHALLLDGGPLPVLNLGGGFGIPYTGADRPRAIEEIAATMARTLQVGCAARGIPVPAVLIEPGRAIIGRAGVTLYRVGAIKPVTLHDAEDRPVGVRTYVAVDGGMSDNARPALYEADYTPTLAGRASDAAPTLVRVVGKHCESGDIVVNYGYLPADVRRGDLVAVADTGAYCASLSSNYNMVARPGVVAVDGGEAHWIVYPETLTDLLLRDPGVSAPFIAEYPENIGTQG